MAASKPNNRVLLVLLILVALLSLIFFRMPPPENRDSADRPREIDYATALRIAEDAWLKEFGSYIYTRKPFRARRVEEGNWHVIGTLPKGFLGGVPEAIISKEGKLLKVWFSR
jgi:hypothetical protein